MAAADGPDLALADIACDEYRQGHLHLCAQYLVQALEFTPRGDPRRHSRLLPAAELLLLVGDLGRAGALSAELRTCPPGPWSDYVTGYLHMVQGRPDEAQETLVRAHSALADPAAAPPAAPKDLRARICVQESTTERHRILASPDSFDRWLSLACPPVHRAAAGRVEPVRNWLRMAFG